MTVAERVDPSVDELIGRQRCLLAELREVEHWRRLVAARLDLAIAAVTDIDELSRHALPSAPGTPGALRDLLGIPPQLDAQPDASVLIPLRQVLDDLDRYGQALRDASAATTRALLQRREPGRPAVVALRPSDQDAGIGPAHPGPKRTGSSTNRSQRPPARPGRFSRPAPTTGEEAG